MLSRQELLVPQAQNCCNHGNKPGTGSGQGASLWPGGFRAVPQPLRGDPTLPPQPVAVRILFLGNRHLF